MITLSDILTRVHRRSGQVAKIRGDAQLGTTSDQDDLLTDFVTDGLARIARTNRLKGTITWETEADVYNYTVPDGVRSVEEVWINSLRLEHRDGLWVYLQAKENVVGTASYWGVHGGQLYIDKTPAADGVEMLLHVTYSDAYPVGDTEDILDWLPEEYREPLTDFVLAQWFKLSAATDLFNVHMGNFDEGLRLGAADPMDVKYTARTYRGI